MRRIGLACVFATGLAAFGCGSAEHADILLVGGRVYTFTWPEPDRDGRPASGAPHDAAGWRPDAQAVALRGDRIVFVGQRVDGEAYRGPSTRVIDLKGATVLPGLIDSHVHLPELGASLERVNLVGVKTEADAVARVEERARTTPKGEWIVGWGWDEGAWANKYPDMRLLSERVPDHPVILRGLHTFAVWGNRLAFERAKITATTPPPVGGEIRKDSRGQPTGILLNNAGALLTNAMPAATPAQLAARVVKALDALAAAGYVSVHEAGADAALLATLEELNAKGQLAIPVYTMLAARDPAVMSGWTSRASPSAALRTLVIRSVKAFYDGAMGSRGAFFFEDYSDRPGHRGTGGKDYGFDRDRMAAMMRAGFQVVIHAIGDRANREALDFFQEVMAASPDAKTVSAAHRARAGRERRPTSQIRRARRHRVDAAVSCRRRHAVGRGAHRTRTHQGCVRVAIAPPGRRADDLQLGSAGDRLQHLLWTPLSRHAHRQGASAVWRLAAGRSADD